METIAKVAKSDLLPAIRGLDAAFAGKVAAAAAEGKVLRYVGSIKDGHCRVAVETVAKELPLGSIRDGENALVLHTHYYQPIPMVLRGYGAGAAVTAAGVFGDLLRTVWRPLDQNS
jgi:aspartokinase/homoserine dehydrogenase 1